VVTTGVSQIQRIADIVRQEIVNGRPLGRYTQFVGGTTTWQDLKVAGRFLCGRESLIDGPRIAQYERAFAEFLGVKYAVSFGSGRMALYAILKAMGIGTGDDVLVLGYTCVVVPNAILLTNARPVYVDLDPKTLGIDPTTLESRITTQTRAIVVQHTLGIPTDMAPIMRLAKKRRLRVIEDCAHAIGSTYEGQMVGTFGDAAFFSSEHSKCISTGKGGMATTDDKILRKALYKFQNTCQFPDKSYVCRILLQFVAAGTLFHFPLSGIGRTAYSGMKFLMSFPRPLSSCERKGQPSRSFEIKLSNAQAALGLSQLQQLPQSIAHRQNVAQIYKDELERVDWPVIFPIQTNKTQVVFLRYPIWVSDNRTVQGQKRIELEIGNWFKSPVYLCDDDSWDAVHYQAGSCLVAEDTTRRIINLPTHSKVPYGAAHTTIKEIISRFENHFGG
jgi:perosamine synthetase